MIPVLSAEQTRIADNWTIEHEPIVSLDLMERAAAACTGWISAHYGRSTRFRILCGPGNNGGDGLAIARQLYQSGYDVTVDRISVNDRYSTDHLRISIGCSPCSARTCGRSEPKRTSVASIRKSC